METPKIENSMLVTSEQINEIATALSTFQGEVENIKKENVNPFFKSTYAALDSIVSGIRKPLAKNGLSIVQVPLPNCQLTTILMHKSGQFIKSTYGMTPKDQTPQSMGSVITYMRRYAISAVLGLATEDDDDGNSATQSEQPATVAIASPKVYVSKKAEPVLDVPFN